MQRRHLLSTLLAAPIVLFAGDLFAGSYLNRAALLLDTSRAERDMVLPRSHDKELLRVVHEVASARARIARSMEVPKQVAGAHPHLLLVLENSERAYAAALDESHDKFLEHIFRARTEDQIFRTLIEKLGYTLPRT